MSDEEAPPPAPERPSRPIDVKRGGGRRRRERRKERADARQRDARLDRVALGGVTLLVLLGPMLFGGAFPWATSILAALAAATLLACGISASASSSERAPAIFGVLLLLVVWTAVQAAPLPASFVRLLSPASVEDAEVSAALLGHAVPSYVALSRAPGATWTELIKGIAALTALVAGYVLARRGHRVWVLSACGASGALTAVVALGHLLADAHSVFGVYEPVYASSRVLGPLLNANHLGGVMAFSAPLATGLATTTSDRRGRIAWILCALACAGVCALALSRGAFGALVLGMLLLGGWASTRSRRSGTSAARQWAMLAGSGLVAASIAGAVYLSWDVLLPQFTAPDAADKLDLGVRGLRLVSDAPWIGVGRGAFGEVFVRVFGDVTRFTYPENLIVQWLSEWGLPAGIAALAAFATSLLGTVMKLRSPARAGAFFGIVALAAQNLVDFSLEMSGVVVLVAVALGAVLAPRTEEPGPTHGLPMRRLALVSGIAGLVCVAALAPVLDRWSVPFLEKRLRAANEHVDRTEFRATLALALKLHPSEPTFPLLAAAGAIAHRSPDAPAWLNRAMNLAPHWAASHLLAAAWLQSRGRRGQAWLELREAGRLSPTRAAAAVCALRASEPGLKGFEASIPGRAAERVPYLRALAACLPLSSPEAVRVDVLFTGLRVDAAPTRQRTARRALARGDTAAAVHALQAVPAARRDSMDSALLADALTRLRRPEDALRELDAALRRTDDPHWLLVQKARTQAALHDEAGVRATIETLRDTGGGNPVALGAAQQLLGDLELQLGHPGLAVVAYELAYTYSGNDAVLGSIGGAAERLGDRRRALAAWERLCSTVGPASPACAQRDRLQALERANDLQQPTVSDAPNE
jgi:tetratricopeptide (TPR) repeat protein/O-antigen ligase